MIIGTSISPSPWLKKLLNEPNTQKKVSLDFITSADEDNAIPHLSGYYHNKNDSISGSTHEWDGEFIKDGNTER